MKTKLKVLLIALSILTIGVSAYADNRAYVWTYEYKTMEAGEVEFEHYLTLSTLSSDTFKGMTSVEHNVEFEIGMTNHFDFAIYQVFKQLPEAPLKYNGYKLRFRYRFGEKGDYLMDPILYFEYKGKPDFSEHGLEGKLILAKDINKFNVAINPVFEYEYEHNQWESKIKYNAGVSYNLNGLFKVGLEARGSENGHYIGPVVSHGTEKAWAAFGSAIAITDIKNKKPEVMLRMILGINL